MVARFDLSMPVGNEGRGYRRRSRLLGSGARLARKGRRRARRRHVTRNIAACRSSNACRCLRAQRRLRALRPSSTRSPRSAWSRPCAVKATRALVHTAAASNLGQMLNRICLKDGILPREHRPAIRPKSIYCGQWERLTSATRTRPPSCRDLIEALSATGATIAFDAIGGGKLAGQILMCMEAALLKKATQYSRYGSTTHKQVYIYGGLGQGPIELNRNFGMAWGIGGWLITPLPAEDRTRRRAKTEAARCNGTENHLRKRLRRRSIVGRSPGPQVHRGLRPSRDGA